MGFHQKEKRGSRLKIKKILFAENFLKSLYLEKKMTIKEISIFTGCSSSSVHRAFKKLGIQVRKPESRYPLLNDKEWLKDCYLNKKYSTTKISELAGCQDGDGIVYGMLKNTLKVPMRNLREAQKIRGLRDRRENSSSWKGGRIKNLQGYIFIYKPEHHLASKVGYVAEHRLVAEKKIGRDLRVDEIVHHVNGKKNDNRPQNLVVLNRGDHKMTHDKILKELSELRIKLEKYEKHSI